MLAKLHIISLSGKFRNTATRNYDTFFPLRRLFGMLKIKTSQLQTENMVFNFSRITILHILHYIYYYNTNIFIRHWDFLIF